MRITPSRATRVLNDFPGLRVVVIGDYYVDRYVNCHVHGVSPEKPVLRVVEDGFNSAPGAAGHVAACFAALGARVTAIGIVGSDDVGHELRRLLQSSGVSVDGLLVEEDRKTGLFERYLVKGASGHDHHLLRVDHEDKSPLSLEARGKIIAALHLLSGADCVFLADYSEQGGACGVIDATTVSRVLEITRPHSQIVAGSSRTRLRGLQGVDCIFANSLEAELAGVSKTTLEETARLCLQSFGARIACVTAGSQGVACATREGVEVEPSYSTTVVDACGAGDSFAAAFMLAVCRGVPVSEACSLGTYAASVSVEWPGTHVVTPPEIHRAVRYGTQSLPKLRDTKQLLAELKELRKDRTIVFTNGCFDLFHSGHVEFLRQARALGDFLIVGINSDRSTAMNKGPGRPVLSEESRIKILSSLEYVDCVIVFDELTPIGLIRDIRPDILVKGGNYTPDEVVGRDLVQESGGRTEVIPVQGSVTTLGLIDAIKKASDGSRHG